METKQKIIFFSFLSFFILSFQLHAQLFKIDTTRKTNQFPINIPKKTIPADELKIKQEKDRVKKAKRKQKFKERMNYIDFSVSQSSFMLNNKNLLQGPAEEGYVNRFFLDTEFQYWGASAFYGYGSFGFDNWGLTGTNIIWYTLYMKQAGINIYANLPVFYFLSVWAGIGGELVQNYINGNTAELADEMFSNHNIFVNAGLRLNIPLDLFIGARAVRKIGFIFYYNYKKSIWAEWQNFKESGAGLSLCWYIFR